MTIHVVKSGDTLESIAREYNAGKEDIIIANGLTNPDKLIVGQALVILYPEKEHIVKQGETLYSIAKKYNTSVRQLWRNNPSLGGSALIRPGQRLIISYYGESIREVSTNGYAYPYINTSTLEKTLPYLSSIIPFTYGFTYEGELVDIDDTAIIRNARERGTSPVMMLSTLTDEGGFSNELASAALNNQDIQEKLINNVLAKLKEKGYDALEVDFEYVFPEDKEEYVAFIENLVKKLNPLGYQVSVALAPKTSSAQKGLLYESHDYAALGNAANAAFLMTYEWGYRLSAPMAVAPINKVRQVLDYAVKEIPREKIYLGIPNYGYDWTLPWVKGTAAKSIANEQAIELARDRGAEILFDKISMAPYFYYTDDAGTAHVVWFEDARSIDAKARLVEEYGLKGMSFWNVMKYFAQNWSVINSLYKIK